MNFESTYLILIGLFIGGGLLSALLWVLFKPNWMGLPERRFGTGL